MAYSRHAWVEVDVGAIAANVGTLRSLLAPGRLLMAVVKADGYGHGAVASAEAALGAGADRLGVATVEEAIALRDAGITAPLQVLSEPPPASAPILVEYRITPALFSAEFARALSEAAGAAGAIVPFHLKVDTGMNRIGVRAEDAAAFAASLRGVPSLKMEGTFTHFATADLPGDWEFERQVERFRGMLLRMKTEGVSPGIVHAANSPATILHPEVHFDMVRTGVAIYGLHPASSTYGKIELVPAMTVKARVSRVSRIGMGEGVSYGFTYHAAAPTTIAALPLGYADGVHRVASNRMRVLVRDVECRQVGRICMDQLMLEVPAGVEVRPGDEAVLVGTQGERRISMDDHAETAQTINYETSCAFGMRMERRYV